MQSNRDKKSLMPVTIKQLSGVQPGGTGEYMLDGLEISQVKFVGRVVAIEDEMASARILIHDGTGTVQLTHYTEGTAGWTDTRARIGCVPVPFARAPWPVQYCCNPVAAG